MSSPTARWTEAQTLHFIQLYKSRPCLWDPDSAAYKDRDKRNIALQKILQEMKMTNITINDLKNKIKNVRSHYCQELKKIKFSIKNGADQIYRPSLSWFNELDEFLRNVVIQKTDMDVEIPPEFNEIHHEDDDLDVSYANDQDTNVRPPTRQPVKRRREYCDVSFPQSTSLFDNFSEDSSAGVRNEFEIFGQGVAVQLNCMPLVEALQAQLEIQELLTRKRLRLCREARTNKTVPVEVPTEVETLPNPAIIKAEPPLLTLIRHQT